VREPLPEFGGENESWVNGDAVDPLDGVVWPDGIVERCVDLDGVKEFSEVAGFVKTFAAPLWVDVAEPIWIRPAGWAHANDGVGCGADGSGGGFFRWRHGWNVLMGALHAVTVPGSCADFGSTALLAVRSSGWLQKTAQAGVPMLPKHGGGAAVNAARIGTARIGTPRTPLPMTQIVSVQLPMANRAGMLEL
jgi:hypothetical protein